MAVRIVEDPIGDPRWSALVEQHYAASIFHTPGWLSALRQTYGYEPFVLSTSDDSRLDNGLVLCRVKGWGSRRLVSLPFSDHCAPLVDKPEDLSAILTFLNAEVRKAAWKSVEVRPRSAFPQPGGLTANGEYCQHMLDLTGDEAELFGRFHHSNTQRAIRRAEREGLTYEAGTSAPLLEGFYRLLRMTRRRHGLPPQPFTWFQNLVTALGDRLAIHVASKEGQPIASMLTLSFRKTMVYRYGGSDAAQHRLGGIQFLFWRVIRDSRARGFAELDLGRSDIDQPGLIAFKDHLGATQSRLTYYRAPARSNAMAPAPWMSRAVRGLFAHLPNSTLDMAGRLLYRHLG